MRLWHVKIFPTWLSTVYTKNATLFGALVHQTLFQGQVTSLGPLNAFIVRGKTKLNIAIWPPSHAIRALSTWDIGLRSIKQWIQQLYFPIIKILNSPNVPWSWPPFWLSKSELTEASLSAAVEYNFWVYPFQSLVTYHANISHDYHPPTSYCT